MLRTGAVLDRRYEILGLIATSGMGEVYRARRTHLGDEVAIKIIKPVDQGMAELRDRFLRESRASAQLRHPHIVTILDYNIDDEGRPFLVMEYLNGPSLRQEMELAGPMDLARVRQIVGPVCAALRMAHESGVVHRDLKPSNFVSHRYGSGEQVYKIIDFGLASIRPAGGDETRLTTSHRFVGTIEYAAPEQFRGEDPGPRTDIYSLGAVVYHMLTGVLPFGSGQSILTIVTERLNSPAPAIARHRSDLPASIDETLRRAMAPAPEDRWTSMEEFARALVGQPAEPASAAGAWRASGLLATYDLGRLLGRGRLGSEIYAGTHRAMGHPVAVRVLRRRPDHAWDTLRKRFLQEARTLQVAHPSVLQVRDFGEEHDVLYLVTDFVESVSLRERLAQTALSWDQVSRYVLQLLDAAAAIHRRGGLLSGVSPDLIRVAQDEDGERLVISTGAVVEIHDLLATVDEQALRGAGSMGELAYLAPEVLTGKPPDVRSDVFTIGVLAFEMATGSRPFDAPSWPELIGAVMKGDLSPRLEQHPHIPAAMVAVVRTSLAADPAQRFASAAEMRKAWIG